MIEFVSKEKIEELLTDFKDRFFVVNVKVDDVNKRIQIFMDRYNGNISLSDCEQINRFLYDVIQNESGLNYEIEVSSPGLTTPLVVWQQYYKNIGKKVKVHTSDNRYFEAEIIDADEEKVKLKNIKTSEIEEFKYSDLKKVILKIF